MPTTQINVPLMGMWVPFKVEYTIDADRVNLWKFEIEDEMLAKAFMKVPPMDRDEFLHALRKALKEKVMP